MSADLFQRMPLVSKKNGRISPYDLLLVKAEFAHQKLSLPHPIPPLYNGIDGVVIINASFDGIPCAVRMQGLNGNIARSHNTVRDRYGGETRVRVTPLDPIDDRDGWRLFIRGLQRGAAFQFGPRLYSVFETTTGVVSDRDNRNTATSSLKSLLVGVDAVELMKGTLFDYGYQQHGELNIDDFNQFVELYTRMKRAYASVAPKFPFDLHANNCMYKLENGKRVWLWTDIDEGDYYMRPNHDTPREMAVKLFTNIQRPDAMYTPAPRSPPKKAASPRRSALAVVPAPPKRRPGVPTSSDIARQEAKAQSLLRRKKNFPVVAPEGTNKARPAVRKPVRTLAQAKSSRAKKPISPYKPGENEATSPIFEKLVNDLLKYKPEGGLTEADVQRWPAFDAAGYSPGLRRHIAKEVNRRAKNRMSDAKVVSRKSRRSPIKPYSPMMDAKVISKPKRKSSRQLKPYAPMDAYAATYANLGY